MMSLLVYNEYSANRPKHNPENHPWCCHRGFCQPGMLEECLNGEETRPEKKHNYVHHGCCHYHIRNSDNI
jgi:hypothetical protein